MARDGCHLGRLRGQNVGMSEAFTLRPAAPADLPAIVGLIRELADFEHLSHLVVVTPESLQPHLFGDKPAAEAVVAEVQGQVVGQVGLHIQKDALATAALAFLREQWRDALWMGAAALLLSAAVSLLFARHLRRL